MDDMMFFNRHYIRIREDGCILDGFSDAFRQPQEGAVCISEQGGYQFRLRPGGAENPQLLTEEGIPLYRWSGTEAILRDAAETEAERSAVRERAVPDAQADTDALLIDHELRLTLLELGLGGEVI